ncbi:SpoIID/LytB domain-containing protein [Polyangium sorediatum]|uniref:SpoIID/LytB domain-containing protein n=1 Tax=Polyangium sorediatum TaxID=889274 RepID=A0ABT6P8Z8_9BACT|nr:SpoIID/LytB domain-containing protein [Polyangium sorediatum]MDI1437097.1 SpoIID/LytB domain-containing protein [Polyangium sorediatum]
MSIPIGDEPSEAPERILTTAGWLSLEREYVPRVVAGEHLHAHPEAKAALAIAARTFVLRAMRDTPTLGHTTAIPSGEQFQVLARYSRADCIEAATRTRGIVLRYQGRMILANHVAGAYWRPDGSHAPDPTNTERWVTYNAGRRGRDVSPTRLSLRSHPGNRGGMGQHCAHWLAMQGYDYATILRFFYGEDIEFHEFPSRENTGLGQALFGVLALAIFGVAMRR